MKTQMKLTLLATLSLFASAACGSPASTNSESSTFYQDADGDGYGNPGKSIQIGRAHLPAGYVPEGNDCNDTDPLIHPKAKEKFNDKIDQNCDGTLAYLPARTEDRDGGLDSA